MRVIIALGGISGAGKTHLRTRNRRLRGLLCVDIADAYDHQSAQDWQHARDSFLEDLTGCKQTNAMLCARLSSTRGARTVCVMPVGQIQYVWVARSKQECMDAVLNDARDDQERRDGRIRRLEAVDENHQVFWNHQEEWVDLPEPTRDPRMEYESDEVYDEDDILND
ncbi:hypothetical protein HDU98_002593 [Podochytrium sp. JEL0797]|nr:hypothetical protein HDU98_002593 [Podochytrium sp. JEL0797]